MNLKVNPKILILARESRNETQESLAKKLDISQGFLSKIEQGLQSITPELLNKYTKILRYQKSFFKEEYSGPIAIPFYRKKRKANSKTLLHIESIISIRLLHLKKLLHSVDVPESNLPEFNFIKESSPKELAIQLRYFWKVPRGPIDNLSLLLEKNGIIILPINYTSEIIDAQYVVNTLVNPPVIFANIKNSTDRYRFSLAHELGHIIMKDYRDEEKEKEADIFASEFLMPEDDIKEQLSFITNERLLLLKRYWKVSIASILMKAKDIGAISDDKYVKFIKYYNFKRYRYNEPIVLEPEEPLIFNQLMKYHKENLFYSPSELSDLFGLYIDEYNELYEPQKVIGKLKLVLDNL